MKKNQENLDRNKGHKSLEQPHAHGGLKPEARTFKYSVSVVQYLWYKYIRP
jgi:hypothetical protein